MSLTDFELDRLEAARLNSREHRQESPNKRVLQLAFEEIELLRNELANVGYAFEHMAGELRHAGSRKRVRKTDVWLIVDGLTGLGGNTKEFAKRKCRVDKPEGMKE